MPFDNHLSGSIAAFLLKLKEALPGTDPGYNKWVALNYPKNTCLLQQQRQRVIGIALNCYAVVTGRQPDRDQIRRVIAWSERNPFIVVDEHIAVELYTRFHSDVPVHRTMITSVSRSCMKFRYPLVVPEVIGK